MAPSYHEQSDDLSSQQEPLANTPSNASSEAQINQGSGYHPNADGTYPTTSGVEADPRTNIISMAVSDNDDDANPTLIKLWRTFQIMWNIMELICISIILPKYWEQPCDREGFRVFLVARGVINVFTIFLHLIFLRRNYIGWGRTTKTLFNLTEYCFVLYALIELGEMQTCKATSPATFGLTLAFVIASMLVLCSPLLALVLICFCLPCIMAVLVHLANLVGAPVGATATQLEELPTFPWTPTVCHEHLVQGNTAECAICLIEYETGNEILIYPACHHAFHADCAKQWNIINRKCAVCRSDPFELSTDNSTPHREAGLTVPQSDVESQYV